MGCGDDDGHARLAQPHRAEAVNDAQPAHAETGLDLVGDRLERAQRHGLVGLVVEPHHALPGEPLRLRLLARRGRARRLARSPEEGHHGAIGVGGDRSPQLGQGRVADRLGAQGDAAHARVSRAREVVGAAGHRGDDGQLVAVEERLVRQGVLAVAREAHGVAGRFQDRVSRGQRRPGVRDARALGQLEPDLAGAQLLALEGEEADRDAHRAHTMTPAPKSSAAATIVPARMAAVSM